MPEEINRPPPLEDWEKALLVTALRTKVFPQDPTTDFLAKALARLTDWPLNRAEEAFAEAHLRGALQGYEP